MSILLFLLIAFGLATWSMLYSHKEAQKMLKDHGDWLKNELNSPKYRVVFIIKDIDKAEFTEKFIPFNTNEGSEYNIGYSSEKQAKDYIVLGFRNGYFESTTKRKYPVSNIKEVYIEKCGDDF